MSTILGTMLTSMVNIIKEARPPFPAIPAMLLLCDIKNRSGLSAICLGAGIIARLPEIGIPNGVNADGSENLINKYTLLVAEELIKELKTNGLTLSVSEPGSIKIQGVVEPTPEGAYFTGTNTNMIQIKGALQ